MIQVIKDLKEKTMNSKAIKNIFFLAPLMGALLVGCSSPDANDDESADRRTEAVRVIEIEAREIARQANYTAHLQAFKEVHLAPASPGRIERIHVDAGHTVSAGQLLVAMDETQLRQAMLQLSSLELDYRRIDTLRRAGSVSQQQYDQIRTQYEVAKTNVEFLRENTKMMSPFTGKVSGKYFENGEMFSGAPNTPAGKAAVLSLVQTNRLKVMINVTERFYPHIRPGMEVNITTDTYPGERFTGRVTIIYPTIDPASRTFRIEVSLPNPDEKLRPGMFARASIGLDHVKAIVVPSLAVLKQQGTNERFVFLEENGRAKRVVVEIGDRFDDMVELVSDEIHEGDKLIIAGQARLVDGTPVNIVQR